MNWAESMQTILERSGLSNRAFSARLGLSYETIRRWLPPFAQEPVVSLAVAVADVVGWPVDALANGAPLIGPLRIDGPVVWRRLSTHFPASLIAIATVRGQALTTLAERCGVPPTTAFAWTQGKAEPVIYTARLIAKGLGETIGAMVAGPEFCRTIGEVADA